MAGREHKVLELMTLINEDMVDTHVPEVHKVILPGCHVALEFHDLYLQILLALLQSCEHTPGDIAALLAEDVEGFIDVTQFIRQDLLLNIHRLRYLTELVVRHDDAGIVVVLYTVEEFHTVSR